MVGRSPHQSEGSWRQEYERLFSEDQNPFVRAQNETDGQLFESIFGKKVRKDQS